MPSNVVTIQKAHNDWIDALIANFERELNGILAAAQARTLARLRERLSVSGGKIDRSVANARTLRSFDSIFLKELDRAGYQHLLNELTAKFPGQLRFFQDTLDAISADLKTPLPKLDFSPRDLQVFKDQALSAKDGLKALMESAVNRAKQRIMMSAGGLPFADLAEALAQYLHRALPEATGLAETATSTYYRIIADRGYQIIEKDLPQMDVRYTYAGPLDKLNRPFCRRLEAEARNGRSWERAEIDRMDNGQIPNVFISCGGFRCRHQWLLATDAIQPGKAQRGRHYESVRSDLSEKNTAAVLSALDGSPALEVLAKYPIKEIALDRLESKDSGFYDYDARSIHVNTIRRWGLNYGEAFVPGRSWSMSKATGDKLESMRRSLLHEVAHHLQPSPRPGRSSTGVAKIVQRIAENAYRYPGRPIARYGNENWREYMSETWVAFHVDNASLKAFDPVGYKMIEDILAELKGGQK